LPFSIYPTFKQRIALRQARFSRFFCCIAPLGRFRVRQTRPAHPPGNGVGLFLRSFRWNAPKEEAGLPEERLGEAEGAARPLPGREGGPSTSWGRSGNRVAKPAHAVISFIWPPHHTRAGTPKKIPWDQPTQRGDNPHQGWDELGAGFPMHQFLHNPLRGISTAGGGNN
jgi:hypothetical protein